MKRVLGLDLGSTSIGWALVNEAESNDEKSSIVRLGVRVIPLTTDEESDFEKGNSITTNANRQLRRSMRRNIHRYKLRRRNLKSLLKSLGWIDDDTILSEDGDSTTFETLKLRATAASEKISLEDFAKVLFMINKKRGYKSSRKSSDEGLSEDDSLDAMSVAIELIERGITPGVYCYELAKKCDKFIKKNLPQFFKSDLLRERELIWNTQAQYYPDLLTDEVFRKVQLKNKRETTAYFYAAHNIKVEDLKAKDALKQIYQWRSEAINKQLTLSQFVLVLSELNAELSSSSGYLADISDRSKELYFQKKTVGQYLFDIISEDPHNRLKNLVFYRQDYEKEFDKIWGVQSKYHKELTPELKDKIKNRIIFYQRPLKSKKGLIDYCEFESREVKVSIDGKVKTKINGLRVAPKSSPYFQEFKIWQKINDIKMGSLIGTNDSPLTIEDKNILSRYLTYSDKITKKDLIKLLWSGDTNRDINFEEIQGNTTLSAFYEAAKRIVERDPRWTNKFASKYREKDMAMVKKFLDLKNIDGSFLFFDSSKDPNKQKSFLLWHLLYSYESDNSRSGVDSLIKKVMKLLNIEDEEDAKIIIKIKFAEDYGNLSTKAMRKILPYLKEGRQYSEACEDAGYKHSKRSLTKQEIKEKIYLDKLPIVPKNSLRNPVVEKILNQMVHVINQVASTYGKPDAVRVELSRDLKSSSKERQRATTEIAKAQKNNTRIKDILMQSPFGLTNPSRNDIIRYRLYEELKNNAYKCLYCDNYIDRTELFTHKYDIEHIIPQARLFDDSFANKTIVHRGCNLKKSNRTAIDYIEEEYGKEGLNSFKARVERLLKNEDISKAKANRLLMREEEIPEDFVSRDMRNTQYISRKALEMLEDFVPDVFATSGSITARLREEWQLVNVMKELNWDKYEKLGLIEILEDKDGNEFGRIQNWSKRNDHRHHAMDALTVAFTSRSLIQYLNLLNQGDEKESLASRLKEKVTMVDSRGRRHIRPPFEMKSFRREAKKHLDEILVSIKSKTKVVTPNVNKISLKNGKHMLVSQLTPRGQLHKETIYGKKKTYATKYLKVGSTFDQETIQMVANKAERNALMKRLEEFDNDPKKAFAGKNSPKKNPIFLDENEEIQLPEKVKLVWFEDVYTIKKDVTPDLKIEQVINPYVKKALQRRLDECDGDKKEAFSDLEKNPIYLHEDKKGGITIKKVTIKGPNKVVAIHSKKDKDGVCILDHNQKTLPVDFVALGNNHHVSFFLDKEGEIHEVLVSFYEATQTAMDGLPIFNEHYNEHLGWKHLLTLKQNEYVVMPDPETDFDPRNYNLMDKNNYHLISKHLFRVQKFSDGDYYFRHHLDTMVEEVRELKDVTWMRKGLKKVHELIEQGMTKVRVNHIGEIVQVY